MTGPGTPARFAVLSGKDNSTVLVRPTDPLGGNFPGGLFVAAGDLNGDGRADLIVGAGSAGGPQINIFNGRNGALLSQFFDPRLAATPVE